MRNTFRFLIALLSGAALTLAFSPFDVYVFAFIVPAVLLFLWLQQTVKHAFFSGWLFGVGFFATGTSWIYVSIHQFGNTSSFLAGLITALFVVILGLYFACFGYIFKKWFSKKSPAQQCLLAFPVLWVLFEYARGFLFTGFPWILLGYAQLTTPLHSYAPLIGVYCLSLLTVLFSGALVLLATHHSSLIKSMSLLIIFIFSGFGFAMNHHAWTKPAGKPLKISLIQGNIAQTIKWQASMAEKNINVYRTLTASHWSSKLIVWPEAAFPVVAENATQIIQVLSNTAKQHHSNILFGVPLYHRDTNTYYNGILLIGDNRGEYLKRHLVPFGEYTPLPNFFGKIMARFNIPMSDFSKGPRSQPDLTVQSIQIAPFICYEITFPSAVLRHAEKSNLLVTVSDDSWFGKSVALAQHLQMAQMRSLETGRPQLFVSNTGITAFILPDGKLSKAAPIDQRIVLTNIVQPMTGKTPLMHWRYYFVDGLMVLMLILLLV